MRDPPPGYASREAAFGILAEQDATGLFLKDLFPKYSQALSSADAAWVREVSLGVLRWRALLDFNLARHVPKRPGSGPLLAILRLSAYQLFFMKVPPFAAVDLGVELAKRHLDARRAGFVNAVLKRMAAEGLQKAAGDGLNALAVNHSHPLWLVQRWRKRLGREGLLRALERNNLHAPAWIRVNPFRARPEALRAELADLGVATETDAHAPLFLNLAGKANGEKALHSQAFAGGKFSFQDPAAWWVAELVHWEPGKTVLDLCSAPGGKAACLLERARYRGNLPESNEPDGAAVVCNDISFRRMRRIGDAVHRLGHQGLLSLAMDPEHPALRQTFDVVLVDAPCSNLGVLRRRPEAKWSHTPEDLERLAALQKQLLSRAASLTAAKGRIVYATCSPEEEETREVVKAFLAEHPGWALEDAGERLPAWAVKWKCLWLYPGETEYDGFFAASLVRYR